MWMVATYRGGGHYTSSSKLDEWSQWLRYDDGTVNIDIGFIIVTQPRVAEYCNECVCLCVCKVCPLP